MHRIFIPPEAVSGGQITVSDPGELHHLLHVLRVNVGDRLECFDGEGRAYQGRISRSARAALTVAIDTRTEQPHSRPRLVLAQALIKPERFEWIVQKATELGAARIIPLVTSRTTIRLAGTDGGPRLLRWRRIAKEAAAQCGRATLPSIDAPQPLDTLLAGRWTAPVLLLTLTVPSARPLGERLAGLAGAAEVWVLIGPEGDFSPEEVALASQHGATPVRLGRLTLRSETAAIVALAILQHAVGAL